MGRNHGGKERHGSFTALNEVLDISLSAVLSFHCFSSYFFLKRHVTQTPVIIPDDDNGSTLPATQTEQFARVGNKDSALLTRNTFL